MKRCNDCNTFAPEGSPFCMVCGSSFGLKLCPRLHRNPPVAQYCRTCGSRQLSRPHRASFPRHRKLALLVGIVGLASGVFLTVTLLLRPPAERAPTATILLLLLMPVLLLAARKSDRKKSLPKR
jgi:RNA polymerase subunit RPABC4/transcription elongation factor Spt4